VSMSSARAAAGPIELVASRVGRANAALAIIAGAYLMIALDSTVVNVALPRIGTDLRFSPTDLAWVFNAYLLTFGGLLLLGGRVGDVFGRRRAFITGLSLFTFASLLAGTAASDAWLIAARGLQGVGAALATPNTMALLATNFEEGPARNRALSVYAAVAMGGASVGLVVGGVLTTYASWRWAMFINLPIGAAIAFLAPRFLDDTERRPGRLDATGALVSTLAMGSIVFGLIRAGSNGWDEGSFASLAAGVALLSVFLVIERQALQPIVPLHLLRNRRRIGAYLNMMLFPTAFLGPFFFLTQYLQETRGFAPLEAGLAFLPQTFATVLAVRVAPWLLARYGAVRLLLSGGALVATGVAALTRLTSATPYAPGILVPLMLIGTGVGWTFMPLNVTILAGVRPGEAGAASAVAQAMQWVGGSLGLAILVTVFGAASKPDVLAAADTAGAPAAAVAAELMTRGVSSALTVGVLFALATMAVTLTVIARGRTAE
jgi:EmrB/QacA subfamily drug resistance transporter